jgi:hypothetical protein
VIRNYVNVGFVVVGGFVWYMAWRAEARRRALFEQAQRLMESRQPRRCDSIGYSGERCDLGAEHRSYHQFTRPDGGINTWDAHFYMGNNSFDFHPGART